MANKILNLNNHLDVNWEDNINSVTKNRLCMEYQMD